jgi:hypothetical protein
MLSAKRPADGGGPSALGRSGRRRYE